jgi:hypothetical protein
MRTVMADTRDKGKTPPRWPVEALAAPTSKESSPTPAIPSPESSAGRVVHDERGNAVWNWAKETGRFCIDSTSALLRKLNIADLKVEGHDELKLEDKPTRDEGGGYDPYNQKMPLKKPKPPIKK